MDRSERELMAELRQDLAIEAVEQLEDIEARLVQYEKNPDEDFIRLFRRILHSIKGSAQAAELDDLEKVIHMWENKLNEGYTNIGEFVTLQLDIIETVISVLKTLEDQSNKSLLFQKIIDQIRKI